MKAAFIATFMYISYVFHVYFMHILHHKISSFDQWVVPTLMFPASQSNAVDVEGFVITLLRFAILHIDIIFMV
jgi:hypothetical protein